jgi:hypothetical protein
MIQENSWHGTLDIDAKEFVIKQNVKLPTSEAFIRTVMLYAQLVKRISTLILSSVAVVVQN